MSDTRIEITGNIIVHHPVKKPLTIGDWITLADIMEKEREREARDERRASYYRSLLLEDSLGEAFQKAVS